MPAVHPFRPFQFPVADASALVAPPYDVLDGASKQRLLARGPDNIVAVDLPHTPAKELGPPEAYARAGERYRAMIARGTLTRPNAPALFAYRQTFRGLDGRPVQRRGVCACVDLAPFGPRAGGGILPHEETFSGPKQDRLALMRATSAQLSPVFGLHQDERGRASDWAAAVMARRGADLVATVEAAGEAVRGESWRVDDPRDVRAFQDALAGEDVFIADGHHRYTTQLTYAEALGAPAGHPARRCMMVLVSMGDPGLAIWPTHRVLGGMAGYTLGALRAAASDAFRLEDVPGGLDALGPRVESSPGALGLFDFATSMGLLARPIAADPLGARFADKPRSWRGLDVAIVQHALVEDICQARLNAGKPVTWAFPHTLDEVRAIGAGRETGAGGGGAFGAAGAQLAVLLRPTPLAAVRDICRAGVLMPQKSTFFYPKLATGLWINPLEGEAAVGGGAGGGS